MATIVTNLTDNRTLAEVHALLMRDIEVCSNMIGFEPDEDETDQDIDYRSELEDMCRQLHAIEEVTALRWAVDCDCFYTGKDRQ